MLCRFPIFQPPFLFVRVVHHPFFGEHTPSWFACQTSFCISPFLCVVWCFVGVFSFVLKHFVSQLASMGLAIQPHKCMIWFLASLPFCISFLIDFFALQMVFRFWVSWLDICFYFFHSIRCVGQGCSPCRCTSKVRESINSFWDFSWYFT